MDMLEPSPNKAVDDLPKGCASVYDTPRHTLAEPKIDGVRMLLHIFDGRTEMTSRRRDKSGQYRRLTDHFPHLIYDKSPIGYTILDGELVMPQLVGDSTGTLGSIMSIIGSLPQRAIELQERFGWTNYYVFDILFFDGLDVRKLPLIERLQALQSVIQTWRNEHVLEVVRLQVQTADDKRAFMTECLDFGYEGIVLKNPNSGYYDRLNWLKVKQHTSTDAIVHGFKMGNGKYKSTLGALKCSVIDDVTGELVSICAVAPTTDSKRDELFVRLNGLSKEEILDLGIIVELECQGWTKDNRMRHPRIKRFRLDRSEPNSVNFEGLKKI